MRTWLARLQTAAMLLHARSHLLPWAMATCGIAAMLSAHEQWFTAYAVLKPLTMVLALVWVWQWADRSRHLTATRWLLAGLLCSMVGDVCLLTERGFLPGLVAFLLAHVCYILLFRRDRPWQRHAWVVPASGIGLLAAAMYLYLFHHGLPGTMRAPVALYVLVIAVMAVQSVARAITLRTGAAWCVAAGAISFMVSDSILAFNRFVAPVPASSLWVLGTYYLAQWLIVHGMLQTMQTASRK